MDINAFEEPDQDYGEELQNDQLVVENPVAQQVADKEEAVVQESEEEQSE
jgi:hypothetical protein